MNKNRREKINMLKAKLQSTQSELKQISSELSSILSEEQDAFDNMPEGLQSSYRGMIKDVIMSFEILHMMMIVISLTIQFTWII